MQKKKIAVLGTQASGKGTQAHILSVVIGAPAVSVGDLLRELQDEDSDRGHAAKDKMSKGSFVADDVIMPLVKEWAEKHQDGWIMDGFPRSVPQAVASSAFFRPDAVVYLEIPDEEAHRRISYRRVCVKCKTNYNLITQPPRNPNGVCDMDGGELVKRGDDTPELVTERLRAYHEITEPLKQWYAQRGLLILIDGKRSVQDVAREIQTRLEERFRERRRSLKIWRWAVAGLLIGLLVSALFIWTGYAVG